MVIQVTYALTLGQTIEESVLSELLGLVQENAVGTWIELYGWKVRSHKLCFAKLFVPGGPGQPRDGVQPGGDHQDEEHHGED